MDRGAPRSLGDVGHYPSWHLAFLLSGQTPTRQIRRSRFPTMATELSTSTPESSMHGSPTEAAVTDAPALRADPVLLAGRLLGTLAVPKETRPLRKKLHPLGRN